MPVQGFIMSDEGTTERIMYKELQVEGNNRIILKKAKAELAKAKEELNRAKESSMQSWLDSEPLIDELEMQKANLADAQRSENTTEKLESHLETIHKSIKSKREDQLKIELMIQETNQTLDNTRNDMERLKLERNKDKKTLAKLRQTLHLRKQTVQTLQLTLQAVLLESDAVEESSATVLQQINHPENRSDVVQLTNENYYALTRRTKEMISHANSRVSVSMTKKLAAEASRDLALSRLNKIYSSRSWSMNKTHIMGQRYTDRNAGQDTIVEEEVATNVSLKSSGEESLPKSKGGKQQHSKKSVSNDVKIIKKRSSILHKMRKCLYGG